VEGKVGMSPVQLAGFAVPRLLFAWKCTPNITVTVYVKSMVFSGRSLA